VVSVPVVVAGTLYQTEWVTLAGGVYCTGCGLGQISAGRRALRFQRGPSGVKRLTGLWFHGFDCLAQRAEREAVDEEEGRSGRGEPYRDLESWARQQERLRRQAGRV